MINTSRLLQTLMQYINIQSQSYHEKACLLQLTQDLQGLSHLNSKVFCDEAGVTCKSDANNLYCLIEGDSSLEPLLFCAHMDTVNHEGAPIVPIVEGDIVHSDGDTILSADDKSGIAAILEALRILDEKQLPHRPIEILFTICEEVGLLGSKSADLSHFQAKCAIVPDTVGIVGNIVVKAPGQTRIYVDIEGKPAHAGICPEKGVSAIMAGSEAIANMPLLRIDQETTANVGTFVSRGATNIVAEQAYVEMEVRSRNKEKLVHYTNRMTDCFEKAAKRYGARVTCQVEQTYEPFDIDAGNPYLLMMRNTCEACGIPVDLQSTGGGSDSNIFNRHGIISFNVGSGMHMPHTKEETLSIPEFIGCANVMLHLMMT